MEAPRGVPAPSSVVSVSTWTSNGKRLLEIGVLAVAAAIVLVKTPQNLSKETVPDPSVYPPGIPRKSR